MDAGDRAASIFGSIGDQPSAAVTMLVACTRRSSAPVLSFCRPWATTVTAVTSITPIISALAVTAVRPGLRIALRRASVPDGAADARPRAGRRRSARPRTPRANTPGRTSTAASRSAATGAIRVARRAGIAAATTVASVPTKSEAMTVRGGQREGLARQLHAHRVEERLQADRQGVADADARGAGQ